MGWAKLYPCGHIESNTVRHLGDIDERMASFYFWIRDNLPTETLVMERPQGLMGRALESQLGMIGIARALCRANEVKFIPVSPASVKKAAVGRGNTSGPNKVSKQEVIDWAEEKYGKEVSTDEADALAVLEYWQQV